MSVSGPSPDQPTYRTDFKQSVDLFEQSFQALQSSKFDAQKQQYVKVMKETLNTMQESASAMVNQKLLDLKKTLTEDLNEYLSSPTAEHKEKVLDDIDHIKHEE